MLNFKPSDHAGDLVESSDDLEGMAGVNTEEESEDSDVSVDSDASEDDDNIDAVEMEDIGEESGKPNNQENPFFAVYWDDSDVSDTDDSDDDYEDKTDDDKTDDDADDLIKVLKAYQLSGSLT